MATATRTDTDMAHWADGTVLFSTSDGRYLTVEAYIPDCHCTIPKGAQPMVNELLAMIGEGRQALKHVVRPTVIFECNEEGHATSLTPVHKSAPGTCHEDALAEYGYTVE